MSKVCSPKKALKKFIECFKSIKVEVNNVKLEHNSLMQDKICIVSGASKGIGRAVCIELINSGATVIGLARSKDLLMELSSTYEQFIPYECDITELNSIDKYIEDILCLVSNKPISVLINCAGVKNGNDERFFNFTSSEFDTVLSVNAKAPFFWCQKVANYMIKNNIKGHIVNVASIKGVIGEASPYGMSKWGCVCLTEGLGRMLADKGIIVNGVAPGGTATEMAKYTQGDSLAHLATANMRLALPEEIAKIIIFLASDLGNNIVGQVIICDGGQSIQYGNNK